MAGPLIKRRRLYDPTIQTPDHLTFAEVGTDEHSSIYLEFGGFKIRLEPNDTIVLHRLHFNLCDLHNVRDRDICRVGPRLAQRRTTQTPRRRRSKRRSPFVAVALTSVTSQLLSSLLGGG